jgi:DNA adenine methylase
MISWIGGKSKIGCFIRNYIPNNIETYVEPFSGAFWVFFRMNIEQYKNLKTIVYNDTNPLNVNLFLCVKEYNKLWKISQNIPIEDIDTFSQFKSDVFDNDFTVDINNPNFEIAYKYAYILSQVWSGTDPKKGKLIKKGGYVGKDGVYKSKFEIFRSKLIDPKWQNYFDKITHIENKDFEEVVKKYDSPTTYFYCDPPYYLTEHYYINSDFKIETHERLANTLKSIKGRFSLSYYHFDLLDEWFPREEYTWKDKEFAKTAMAVTGKSQTKGTELLIMNY